MEISTIIRYISDNLGVILICIGVFCVLATWHNAVKHKEEIDKAWNNY